MRNKILKIKRIAAKITKKFWEKIWLILPLFLFFDFLIAGALFFQCCGCSEEKCKVPFPLVINQGLTDKFFFEKIKRAEEFKKIPQKDCRDIFSGNPFEELEPENVD